MNIKIKIILIFFVFLTGLSIVFFQTSNEKPSQEISELVNKINTPKKQIIKDIDNTSTPKIVKSDQPKVIKKAEEMLEEFNSQKFLKKPSIPTMSRSQKNIVDEAQALLAKVSEDSSLYTTQSEIELSQERLKKSDEYMSLDEDFQGLSTKIQNIKNEIQEINN